MSGVAEQLIVVPTHPPPPLPLPSSPPPPPSATPPHPQQSLSPANKPRRRERACAAVSSDFLELHDAYNKMYPGSGSGSFYTNSSHNNNISTTNINSSSSSGSSTNTSVGQQLNVLRTALPHTCIADATTLSVTTTYAPSTPTPIATTATSNSNAESELASIPLSPIPSHMCHPNSPARMAIEGSVVATTVAVKHAFTASTCDNNASSVPSQSQSQPQPQPQSVSQFQCHRSSPPTPAPAHTHTPTPSNQSPAQPVIIMTEQSAPNACIHKSPGHQPSPLPTIVGVGGAASIAFISAGSSSGALIRRSRNSSRCTELPNFVGLPPPPLTQSLSPTLLPPSPSGTPSLQPQPQHTCAQNTDMQTFTTANAPFSRCSPNAPVNTLSPTFSPRHTQQQQQQTPSPDSPFSPSSSPLPSPLTFPRATSSPSSPASSLRVDASLYRRRALSSPQPASNTALTPSTSSSPQPQARTSHSLPGKYSPSTVVASNVPSTIMEEVEGSESETPTSGDSADVVPSATNYVYSPRASMRTSPYSSRPVCDTFSLPYNAYIYVCARVIFMFHMQVLCNFASFHTVTTMVYVSLGLCLYFYCSQPASQFRRQAIAARYVHTYGPHFYSFCCPR